jgi:hypothetical protein
MKCVLTACLTAAICTVAAADEVRLTNGRTLVGIARHEAPNRVVVETGLGDLGFPEDQVQSVEPGRSDVQEYKEKLEALGGCPSAADVFALAQWAQERGLIRYVNGLLVETLELDPNHAEARSLLGYVKYDGLWMLERDRSAIAKLRESEHRTVARPTVRVRRTTPKVEETPYPFGLPLLPDRSSYDIYPHHRASYSTSTGGYIVSIGGVTPGGDIVVNYPLRGGMTGGGGGYGGTTGGVSGGAYGGR